MFVRSQRKQCGDLGTAYVLVSAAWILRVIAHCWAMDRTLLTSQYKTRPDGNQRKKMVNINGNAIMIFCCIGSKGAGFSSCWPNMEAPIRIGST